MSADPREALEALVPEVMLFELAELVLPPLGPLVILGAYMESRVRIGPAPPLPVSIVPGRENLRRWSAETSNLVAMSRGPALVCGRRGVFGFEVDGRTTDVDAEEEEGSAGRDTGLCDVEA